MTYEEALKEAYKQPWKVVDGAIPELATIELTKPINSSDRGWTIGLLINIGRSMAEHIVNLHNKSLVEKVEYLVAYDPVASPPKSGPFKDREWNEKLEAAADRLVGYVPVPSSKTIRDLTDEQLFHIWGLAHDATLEYRATRRTKEYIVVGYEDMEDVTLYDDLNIEIHHDGDLEPACNQYQIYEYLRELNIKPV